MSDKTKKNTQKEFNNAMNDSKEFMKALQGDKQAAARCIAKAEMTLQSDTASAEKKTEATHRIMRLKLLEKEQDKQPIEIEINQKSIDKAAQELTKAIEKSLK